MDFSWDGEHEALRQAVKRFAREEVAPLVRRMEEEDWFPRPLVQRMGELGWMGLPLPVHWGGAGKDFPSYILAIEEISRVSPALGVILSVHTSVGTFPIVQYGTLSQRERYLPLLATGRYLGAFALTEPSSGSDAASLRLAAEHCGSDYILNGSKVFITNGGEADTYITFARTDAAKGNRGITAFIVEKETAGFHVGPRMEKMGLHGSPTVELFFENAKVPLSQRLGEEGEGFAIAMSLLNSGRIGIAAQALGIAEGACDGVRDWLQSVQGLKTRSWAGENLARLATAIEAARWLVYQAAWRKEEGLENIRQASMAKMLASDTAMQVSSTVLQLLGEHGAWEEFRQLERYFRDAKVTQIYEGSNEIQRVVIAKQFLKQR